MSRKAMKLKVIDESGNNSLCAMNDTTLNKSFTQDITTYFHFS